MLNNFLAIQLFKNRKCNVNFSEFDENSYRDNDVSYLTEVCTVPSLSVTCSLSHPPENIVLCL